MRGGTEGSWVIGPADHLAPWLGGHAHINTDNSTDCGAMLMGHSYLVRCIDGAGICVHLNVDGAGAAVVDNDYCMFPGETLPMTVPPTTDAAFAGAHVHLYAIKRLAGSANAIIQVIPVD